MTPKPNPFSLYDFLGYFTPGATALYIFYFYVDVSTTRLSRIATSIEQAATLQEPAYLIPFVLLAYLLGHVLSFLSSITVERYYVWVFDYPSKELLRVNRRGFFKLDDHVALQTIMRVLVAMVLTPIVAWDLMLRIALPFQFAFGKSLDQLLVNLIRKNISGLIEKAGGPATTADGGWAGDHDFFRLVYHYAVEHAPNHLPKMQNYVALYGLLRTMSLLAVIVFWVALATSYQWATSILDVARWLLGISVTTFVLYLAFMKFYRRFTLEALMAASVTNVGVDRGARGLGPQSSDPKSGLMVMIIAEPGVRR